MNYNIILNNVLTDFLHCCRNIFFGTIVSDSTWTTPPHPPKSQNDQGAEKENGLNKLDFSSCGICCKW